jgi:hypothetical protein
MLTTFSLAIVVPPVTVLNVVVVRVE